MKNVVACFIFIFLVYSDYAVSQDNISSTNRVNVADSAVYYFQKSLHSKGIDTVNINKAVEFVLLSDMSPNTMAQVEEISKQFRRRHKLWAFNIINETLIQKYIYSEDQDQAIKYCQNIIANYDVSRNPDERYTALVALSELRIPLRNKSIPEAFNYYTDRLKVYHGLKDSVGLAVSYFCLGTTYRLIGLPDMAIYNFKKSLAYINAKDTASQEPLSGLDGWVNHTSVLGQLYLEVNEYETAIAYSQEAREVRLNVVKDRNVAFLNCNIAYAQLMLNKLDNVNNLLDTAIQLSNDYEDYPALVRAYELKGQYFIVLNQWDSAEVSLLKCKEAMQQYNVSHFSPAGSHTPNYHLAKVRTFQNRFKEARALLEAEIIEISNIKKEVLKEQKLLIEVYNKLGDSQAADSTFRQYYELQTYLSSEERKNRSKSYEIEAKIEEAEHTINDLVTQRQIADLTRKYLIGIALLLLAVAVVIFNRFRVTQKQKVIIEKEKQRSEELLLNILPEEVAEELKEKGSADARHFDNATVMFTDFKGFTKIAEKLTAAELVAEIDQCFKAFDNIISHHNIEKIKTIGDAYMCAGGLPVANDSHAYDVVNAGLEIQEYMRKHMDERLKEGKEVFEIRIGIHTGPLVAGIVGLKKFAYDIWGDTVNIAARMESSGEAGKVNISQSTYELVKDRFNCTYRGKVSAKNKGEIDMYFAEGKI